MPKNPLKPGSKEPVREQSEQGTGGWTGPVLKPETFSPPIEQPVRTEETRSNADIHNAKLLGDKTTAEIQEENKAKE